MLSTTTSQKQIFSENTGKSKSASPSLRQTSKKQQEDKRVRSAPTEKETKNLSVQEIVSKLNVCYLCQVDLFGQTSISDIHLQTAN